MSRLACVDLLFANRSRSPSFAGHAATISTLSYAIRFWSKGTKRALFLRHEGYLGGIGAWLKNLSDGGATPARKDEAQLPRPVPTAARGRPDGPRRVSEEDVVVPTPAVAPEATPTVAAEAAEAKEE